MSPRDKAVEQSQLEHESRYANAAEVSEQDEPLLETPTGRADDEGVADPSSLLAEEIASIPIAQPRSAITGRGDPGNDDETADGLNELEEAIREEAEERPLGTFRERTGL
jgi:hypothetical protein